VSLLGICARRALREVCGVVHFVKLT
jgi:hypothetical protein